MKPPPFDYLAPTDITEVLSLLQQYGDDARLLAGGQSLMPLMNMRLARPQVLIDLNRLADLATITPLPSDALAGGLAVGALTRQRAVERSSLVGAPQPLLAAALPLIGHFQIRNRGTIGGSLAHADPAAELPAVSLALEAEFGLRSATGQRRVAADEFFVTALVTALEPGELLTEVRFPAWQPTWGWDIQEICRREGDFALVGAASVLQVDEHDVCQMARLVLFGVGGRPLRLRRAETLLRGQRLDSQTLAAVANLVTTELEPDGDIHASATYRREVGGVLARRTLAQAYSRVRGGKTL